MSVCSEWMCSYGFRQDVSFTTILPAPLVLFYKTVSITLLQNNSFGTRPVEAIEWDEYNRIEAYFKQYQRQYATPNAETIRTSCECTRHLALKNLLAANRKDFKEVKTLIQFSFEWQMMAQPSAISYFGLFRTGSFASYLEHHFDSVPRAPNHLLYMGKALDSNSEMPRVPVYAMMFVGVTLAILGN